jgi:hypothetical protein
MFRAFSFVLVLVLCTSVWSMAHAAPTPRPFQALKTTITGGYLWKDRTIQFNKPFKTALPFNGTYEKEKINLPSPKGIVTFLGFLGAPVASCAASESCKHFLWRWGNNDHKDTDRD